MSKTKASFGVIAATLVTVATLFLLPFTPKLAVRTTTIAKGDLMQTVLLEGVVAYQNQQPLISLQAGKVSGVYVSQGQRVEAGQLLLSMDTSLEEEALATLAAERYQAEQAVSVYGDAAALFISKDLLEAKEQESALRKTIEAKQIRAQSTGIVSAIHQKEGDYVAAGTMLGSVHSQEVCVVAPYQAGLHPGAQLGAAAALWDSAGDSIALATLTAIGAPTAGEGGQYLQQLTFTPKADDQLQNIGQRITVEMLQETSQNVALAPVEAFDEENLLWVVEKNTAKPVKVEIGKKNGQYVCVPDSLVGARVILRPEEYALTSGSPVKEAKAK